jgi:murein DD-endopeptidase MepM/ murein hydrolase activator NlpD
MTDRCRRGKEIIAAATLLIGLGVAGLASGSEPSPADDRTTQDVTLEVRETEGRTRLEARNLRPVPAELLVHDRSSGTEEVIVRILPPLSVTTALDLEGRSGEQAREHVRENYRFVSYMGDPAAIRPDENHLYRLPFKAGKTYRLSQGFHGEQSHNQDTSRYALDFQLEIGEPVHAARAGTVAKVVDWFREAGDRSRIDEANLIVILHDDGTMAHYVHLDHGGALVKEGERVDRGQHIGTSGMTGFTRGPHLHFVVRRERDRAIPVRFEGYENADLSRGGKFRIPSAGTKR